MVSDGFRGLAATTHKDAIKICTEACNGKSSTVVPMN
jgi:hypothetical protein